MSEPIDRRVLDAPAAKVAPTLLNKLLVSELDVGCVVARIVEVEAYDEDDPASHTFGGRTVRNRAMFGPPGHLYVYLSYGIHVCANVVAGAEGRGEAVLLRAVDVIGGDDVVRVRRPGRRRGEWADGPGKLCTALGITLGDYGIDLCAPTSRLRIVDDGLAPPRTPIVGPRIGITKAVDLPRRYRVPGPS